MPEATPSALAPDDLLRDLPARPVPGDGATTDAAVALIEFLGGRARRSGGGADPHPAAAWADCGAMALTGRPEGPPLPAPGPIASRAAGAARALAALTGSPLLESLDAAALLGERAAVFGYQRRGATAPGGSCRLLRADDGWLAVNLARADDMSLIPAWLGDAGSGDPWNRVARGVAGRPADEVVARARLLGLPAAVAAQPPAATPAWCRVAARGEPRARAANATPLVIDLSSLWAGPLCTHLLQLAGAHVVKVESTRRPDGARSGPARFFDLLNSGKQCVALDFSVPDDRDRLRRLVERADVVVESSRPRALAQLGLDAAGLVGSRPGLTWLSITGYGRREPGAGWVAFGDDAAVAAGLAAATGGIDAPLFCGDAIADPLTGLHAAVAASASFLGGGGHLLDVALRDVTAYAAFAHAPAQAPAALETAAEPFVAAPRARRPSGRARGLGADTAAVLSELSIPC